MKKRILSLLLALCMVIALVPAVLATDGSLTKVDGVYQIADAADLVAFAALVNGNEPSANAVLTADITLTDDVFTPIGNESKAYTGTFDGNGKAIINGHFSNASGSCVSGLFGHVGVSGVVKNITFKNTQATNSSTSGEDTSTGIAVGRLYGTVSGITTENTCNVSGMYRTGGIVGDARGTKAVITGCTNNAAVTGAGSYTGGIVGATHELGYFPAAGTIAAKIKECKNYGIINGTSEVGGIVGYADRAEIKTCHNYNSVTGSGSYGTGGILGSDIYNYGLIRPSKGSTITDCTNSGAISAPRAGGILGSFVAAPGKSQPTGSAIYSVITNCTNSGAITGTEGKCGAIFGYQITYAHGDNDSDVNKLFVKLVTCTNSGTVNGATPAALSPSAFVVIS